jgi:Subtilase family/S-layer homology domain
VTTRRAPACGRVATSIAILLLAGLMPAPAALAADPVTIARQELSRRTGSSPNDFQLVGETAIAADPGAMADPGVTGASGMWVAKFIDARTGEIHSSYRDPSGATGSVALLDEARAAALAALPVLQRKADPSLVAAVDARARAKVLRVAIWLDVDVTAAEAAVAQAHPEVEWLAGRPIPTTLDQARALRSELWEARRALYASAAEAVEADVTAAGGTVAYVSTSAPLMFVDMPAGGVAALAERPEVLSLGLEQEWRTFMSSAGPTVGANWTSGGGDQGNGVRVAVVEYHNTANTGDLAGQVVRRRSTTGTIRTHIHPTWVAGAIASRSSTWRGVAPGADIVSSSTGGYTPGLSTDRAVIAAADWAVSPNGGDSDIINASFGQDTATGAEEARRYFDSIGWEDGRLVVAASGNFGTFGHWNVVSPATGYNVLAVGGVNDRNTGRTGDDVLWYGSNGASYRDPDGTAWNPHGDFNKPNLSAPAVSVRTANGTIGDGTSIASPIVAGIGAQLLARSPSLVAWPEATRAILMAGANRRTPMPGGGLSRDHEGVGTASALWSNRILGKGAYGSWMIGTMTEGEVVTRDIRVVKGQRVRVALAWSSHTSGSSNLGKADHLRSDLDLVVRQPNGSTTGSFSFDNSYEALDLTASSTGTMRITVRHDRFDTSQEPFGLAWALTSPFSDIAGSKFYAQIVWVAQRGMLTGCGGGRFCPTDTLTRGQLATALAVGLNLPATANDYFSDDESSPHEADINRLRAAGLTTGCGAGRYCPDTGVRRGPLASALDRALRLPAASRDYFSDDNGTPWEAAINRVAAAGISSGCGGGRYCPDPRVQRAQAAAFLRNAFD